MKLSLIQPVLFLDFDDVLCLNKPFGGYDAIAAIGRAEKEPGISLDDAEFEDLWANLFEAGAKGHLLALHNEFSPSYVLSTSWRNFMNRPALVAILQRTGFGFVAENLHQNWGTPIGLGYQDRPREISNWLGKNAAHEGRWVTLDDERSGAGFVDWPISQHKPFIVICRENVGLTAVEYEKLRVAFRLRICAGKSDHD